MSARARQYKAPYRYARKGGGFVLLEKHVETGTRFKTEAEAKKKVLALNDAWRAKGATRANPRHKYDESRDDAGFRKLSDLKKGEYFKRKPDARKVYQKGDYDRAERKYEGLDTDDISRAVYLKGDTLVYVGFTY